MSYRHFSMGLSCGEDDDFEAMENEVEVIFDESREVNGGFSIMDACRHSVELEVENFWPIEHPMEPQDEDRPVKCPMPTSSSVINDGRTQEDRYPQSLRKKAELPAKEGVVVVAAQPPIRTVRKRHHTLTHGDRVVTSLTRMPPPPPNPNITIFHVLQQLDKS